MVDPVRAAGKGDRNGGQINLPDSVGLDADFGNGLFTVCIKPLAPQFRCACIVFAPSFDIMHLETTGLEFSERMADMVELRARKNIFLQGLFFRLCLAELLFGSFGAP